MFHTDLRTLLLIISINKFLLGMLMVYLWAKIPNISGIKEWAIGSILTSIGLLIFSLYPYPTTTFIDFSFSLSLNLFIMVGDVLFITGFWKFEQQPIKKYLYIFPLLSGICVTVFTLVFKILWIRVLINLGILSVMYLFFVFELWNGSKSNSRYMFRMCALLYTSYGLLQIFRTINAFLTPFTSPMDCDQLSLKLFILAGVSMILLTFSLVIIVTSKLNEELHTEIYSKNKLYTIISHDLRAPFNNLHNSTTILKESVDKWKPSETKKWLEEMEKSSSAFRFLMENLFYWSSSQLKEIQVNVKLTNLTTVIHQTVKVLQGSANSKSIKLTFDTQTPVFAETDENMMQIVLRNIISNAIKFTNEGGEVFISVIEQTDKLEIVISDNGIGISATDLAKTMNNHQIFQTSGTFDEKGSGFGLKLCNDLLALNNGEMKIESSVGIGTTITLLIPKK